MTPRAGLRTATSSSGRHLGGGPADKASSIGAWKRSWILGPAPAKYRTPRSAPRATPIADEDLEARMLQAGLDPSDVGGVDAGRTTQGCERHVRVEADPPDVLADARLDPATAPDCLASDRGRGQGHRLMKPHDAHRSLTRAMARDRESGIPAWRLAIGRVRARSRDSPVWDDAPRDSCRRSRTRRRKDSRPGVWRAAGTAAATVREGRRRPRRRRTRAAVSRGEGGCATIAG